MSAKRSSKTEFNRSVAKGVTLVDFDASWCQPCRKQAVVIKTLEKAFHTAVRIRRLNVDRYQDVALGLGIQSIPTLLLYKDGKEMRRFVGLQSHRVLEDALRKALQSAPAKNRGNKR